MDKHSSLSWINPNDEEKIFIASATVVNVIKLFSLSPTVGLNKLERFQGNLVFAAGLEPTQVEHLTEPQSIGRFLALSAKIC